MSDLTTILAAAATGIMLWALLRYVPYFVTVYSSLIYRPVSTQIDQLPETITPLFRPALLELSEKGFQFASYARFTTTSGDESFSCLMVEPAGSLVVQLSMQVMPSAIQPVTIATYTFFEDGFVLLCTNGIAHHLISTAGRQIQILDSYAPTFSEHLVFHRRAAGAEKGRVPKVELPLPSVYQLVSDSDDMLFDSLIARDILRPAAADQEGDVYHTTLATTARMTQRFFKLRKRGAALFRQRQTQLKQSIQPTPELALAVEVNAYQRLQERQRRRQSNWAKILLPLGTLILFILAFGGLFDWQFALMIVLILAFHEGGHLLAMKLRGYRRLNLIFIPLIGGAAIGEKPDENLHDRAIVLLAGPLPGLLIGALMALYMTSGNLGWLSFEGRRLFVLMSSMLLVINGLNLLPVLPLDGGQLASILFLQNRPVIDVIFKVVTAIAFIGLALVAQNPFVFVIAAMPLLFAYYGVRQLQVRRQLVAAYQVRMREGMEGIAAGFQAIRDAQQATSIGFAAKASLVSDLRRGWHNQQTSTWWRLFYFSFYAGSVALLIGVIFWVRL